MVKNEADIIESFVRHNLDYVDRLFLIVQPGDDGTEQILRDLVDEGLPLEVIRHEDAAFRQGEILTGHAKELLAQGRFHSIIVLDADEFIKTARRDELYAALDAIPEGVCACWTWQSYVPTSLDLSVGTPVPASITHRRIREARNVYKVILNRAFLSKSLYLPVGSHAIEDSSSENVMPKIAWLRGMFLAHFPLRSPSQLRRKVANGIKVLDQDYGDPHTGYHWRLINEIITERDIDLDLIQLIASDYQFQEGLIESGVVPPLMADPLPLDYSLRYSKMR